MFNFIYVSVLFFLPEVSIVTLFFVFSFSKVGNFIKWRLRYRCSANFAKLLITSILQNIWKCISFLCKNICQMYFLETFYLVKMCLPWCLLNKQKKCISLNEISKTLRIHENISTQMNIIQRKTLI